MRDEHPLDDALLGDLFAELRSWGEQPAPAPSEALATLLGDVPAPTAVAVPMAQPRRKRNMLVSKLAALGVAAKAALGVGVAAATMTTASVAGVLPDQAQHAVATAVEAVTSLQLPDPLGSTTTTTLGTGGVGGAGADDDATTDDGSGDGTGQPANHGACVSEVAKDKALTGREHGQTVSAIAQSDCGKKTSSSTTTPTTTVGSTTTTSPTTSTTVANAGSSRGPGSGNSGNANGGNSGNSNAGGNSGNSNGGNSGNSNANGGNSGR